MDTELSFSQSDSNEKRKAARVASRPRVQALHLQVTLDYL